MLWNRKTWGIVVTVVILNAMLQTQAKSVPEDEYLDELLKEFQQSKGKDERESKPEENFVPLNAQSKYLKNPRCNCTKFFMCDVDNKSNPRVVKADEDVDESIEEDEDEEGADLDLINIRLNAPEGGCGHYLDICCEKVKERVPGARKPLPVCGQRNDRGVGFRIIGDNDGEAQFGEFPWMTAIIESKPPKSPGGKVQKAFVCGASLIHPRVILTAAHCVRNKNESNLNVRVGEWDTQTTSELYPHEEVPVDQIILHPNFIMKKKLANDIAMLILKQDVHLAPNVGPICVPSADMNFDGQRCFATGWGKDQFGAQGAYQSILKRVEVPVIPRKTCQNSLRETKLGHRFQLHESFICAGGEEGRDTCKGDGGSPLVCQIPGSKLYVQYGIVSWGIGCGGSLPAVYVNVPHFTPWIEETMSLLGFSEERYRISEPRY